ncbi:MAG TPA: hypothetical protein PLH52_06680 [Paludibacteraceae bacterium]|nr:hypothetical protein [Paludibacteraceae bacterium]
MKKVFQIKLKSITRVFAMVMALSLVTFTGCKSYDQDIDKLNTDLTSLKTELTALNTATQNALQLQITTLNTDITALKARVTTLEQTGATDAEVAAAIAAAKTEIMSKVVTLEAFNAYKATVDADLASLKTKVDAAATKAELTALATRLDGKILEIENTLTALGAKVTTLQTSVNLLGTQLDEAKARISKNEADIAKNITDLAALKADVQARLSILEGVLSIKNGKSEVIDKIQLDLTAQKALIDANTAKIADLQAQLDALKARTVALETAVAKNTADIAKNTADIAKNTADITAIRTELALINDNLKTVANAMHLNFAVLSSRLSSLVYAGDLSGTELSRFYVNGIEAINFSSLMSKCDPITPAITIAYHLNPSFIKEADIETGNMAFVVRKGSNAITNDYYLPVQGANDRAVQVAAIYDHIDATTGIIYVKVSVNDYNTLIGEEGGNYVGGSLETFRSIALQIPLSQKAVQENAIQLDNSGKMVVVGSTEYPANRVITSDYVRLYGENMYAQENVYLARNNAPTYSILPQTLADAKLLSVKDVDGATTTAPQVVTLPYGKTLDLINEVKAIFSGAPFDIVKYGLNYKFDLLDENGNTIVYNRGSNNTDQQQFIKINDAAKGTIEAKVFTQAEIAAAQGRTPIVRVWMYNAKNPSCPVLLGFVKIYMAEKPLPTPITVPFTFADMEAKCADVAGRTTVQQMNEKLYNAVGLSKEEFHAVYTLVPVPGAVSEIKNPDGQTTDTWLLEWNLTAQQIWSALMTANPATFTQTVEYVPSLPTVYPKITITFTRKFTKPADLNIAEGSLIKKYWYDMNGANNATVFDEVKHNVNVPDVNESTTTNCTIKNDLSQAFLQNADKSLKGFSNYEYYFVPNVVGQPAISQPVIAINGVNYQFTPSTDGKQLLNGSEVIATINPFVANVGDILELNRNSTTAKLLLNYDKEVLRARIGIRTKYCQELNFLQPITVNGKPTFDVVFVRPIKAAALSPDHFVDGKSFGQTNTYIPITKMVSLSDWRDYSFASYPNLYGYYGVTNIALSTTKSIETNLNGTRVALSNFPSLQVAYAASVPGVSPAAQYGYLTYQNNGNVIGNSFELYVPVTITYYWGEIVNTWVTVTVDKTVGPSGIRRK